MLKLACDVDGVLRDLQGYLHAKYDVPVQPREWGWRHEGRNMYEWVEHDRLQILRDAPTTEYFEVITQHCKKLELWTHQPPEWRRATEAWLNRHLKYRYTVHYLSTVGKRKRLDAEPETYLIEDNPNFTSYDRIILLTRSYNRHCSPVPTRIRSPKQLAQLLRHWSD